MSLISGVILSSFRDGSYLIDVWLRQDNSKRDWSVSGVVGVIMPTTRVK